MRCCLLYMTWLININYTAAVHKIKAVKIPTWIGILTLAKKDGEWFLRESHFCLGI